MTVKKTNVIRLFFSLLLISFTYYLSAQDLSKDKDFEKRWEKENNSHNDFTFHFGHDWNKSGFGDFRIALIDIGFSTYFYEGSLNLPQELDNFDLTYGGSLNFNLHAIRHRIPIIKKKLRLEYGLTISWMSYKFSNDFQIIEDTIPFSVTDDGTKYKKNKLKTTFLEVPLMFSLTPGKNRFFSISAGVYGGILLGSKQKLKTESGDKIKIRDDFNLNKFRYGLVGRIGFGPISLYAEYALNDLFKEGQGPKLTPFNIGISLLSY